MTESPIVNEWMSQGEAKGKLENQRQSLLELLEGRFPSMVPARSWRYPETGERGVAPRLVQGCGAGVHLRAVHGGLEAVSPITPLAENVGTLGVPTAVVGTLTWDGVAGSTINYNVSALTTGGYWIFGAQPSTAKARANTPTHST